MSKTTTRLGKPKYTMYLKVEGNPAANDRLKKQWAELDESALKEFKKKYDALTGDEKSTLHVNIKEGKYNEARPNSRQPRT